MESKQPQMSKGFIIVEDYLEEIAVKMKKSFQRNSNISTTDETANESLTQRALKPTETQMIFDQVLETSHEEEDWRSGIILKTLADFAVLKLISSNHTNRVYIVRKKETEEILVMKIIKQTTQFKNIEREIKIMQDVDSLFLMGLRYRFDEDGHTVLLMNHCAGGELLGMIQER